MEGPSRPPVRRPRPAPASFRPSFTLILLYFFALFLLFSLLLALPALLEALRELPPGDGPLTPEEQAFAAEAAREALRGRIPYAAIAAVVTLGAAAWSGRLPGVGHRS